MELVLMQNRNADFLIKPVNPDGTAYTPDGSITDVVFAVRSGEFGNVLISKDLEWDEGQSGYVLNDGITEICIDPYLSNVVDRIAHRGRMVEAYACHCRWSQ